MSSRSLPKIPFAYIDPEVFTRLRRLFTDKNWLVDLEGNFLDIWNLCSESQQQDLIEDLIRRFSYITSRDLQQHGQSIANQLTDIWKVEPSKTLVIAFADSDKPDGSQVLLQSIKNKFVTADGWSENNFVNRIAPGAFRLEQGNTAILVDDFTGTGNTARKRVTWFKEKLKARSITEYKIFIVTLALMEAAKTVLDSLPIEGYFACLCLRRGISDEYNGGVLATKTQSMIKLEGLLAKSFRGYDLAKYNFGFQRSEALYSLEAYNIPNNVFPIFWWPALKSGKLRDPMFKHFIG